jgi:hypothetical protein
MMELTVLRKVLTGKSTIGDFLINGEFHSYTLEDCVRTGPKVPGATAIAEGRYQVIIDMSTRFKRLMPHILNVQNFIGVRIHKGNTDQNTEGCILLGHDKGVDRIWDCETAFHPFFDQLQAALNAGEECWITVTHG